MEKWFASKRNQVKLCGLVLIIVSAYAAVPYIKGMFINIRSGEGGVLWKRFDGGTQTKVVYKDGLHIINPFDRMTVYIINEQQRQFDVNAISKDGWQISVSISIRFTLLKSNLPNLHKSIGNDYIDILILPEISSNVRNIIANYEVEDIYKSHGSMIKDKNNELLGQWAAIYLESFEWIVPEVRLPCEAPNRREGKTGGQLNCSASHITI